ncbi:light-inducible protein CPRF2-like [Hibiscus syriacus]|uniref:light-inducible protein CPRF2-like n=1 Tax=Hibiscus syriacus TaxID=106335 RepID=UPI0019240ADF|nr:light-inducible protein CPRF2-like [Hibiscus syriacus]
MDNLFSVQEISAADDNDEVMHCTAPDWDFLRQFFSEERKEEEARRTGRNDDDELSYDMHPTASEQKNPSEDGKGNQENVCLESNSNDNVPVDADEYHQALLKNNLYLACAAVANARSSASFVIPHDSADSSGSQAFDTPGSEATSKGAAEKEGKGSPSLLNGTMDPTDAKRARSIDPCGGFRLQSNRESARRSRTRMQAQMTQRHTQVAQLKLENQPVLRSLADITQKCDISAIENRILTAEVKALEATLKLTEWEFITVTGCDPASLDISTMSMSSFNASPSENDADPVQDGLNHPLYQDAAAYNAHMAREPINAEFSC